MKDVIHSSFLNRRQFLRGGCAALCSLSAGVNILCRGENLLFCQTGQDYFLKPARHWTRIKNTTVECRLCPNQCILGKGETGLCRARKNIDGSLYSLVYSRIAAMHTDPVEKKPLFHFIPGSSALSIATAGCNFSCRFCQNWQLSQSDPHDVESREIKPQELGVTARKQKIPVIAYTYNEPTVQFEYIMDSSALSRKKGIKSIMISNGYIQKKASLELASQLDAVKIDLKAFSDSFYRNICGGSLTAVLDNLAAVHGSGTWLEIVVLIIPTMNDSPGEIKKMTSWINRNLSPHVPVHFTRFHPMYKIRNLPSTPVSSLERCRSIAVEQGIHYAYVGNVPGHRYENTYCHACGAMIVSRTGYFNIVSNIRSGACPRCGTAIPGRWT